MGLLDELLGGMMGQMGGQPGGRTQAAPQTGNALLDLVMQFVQSYPGGLPALLQAFSRAGYGNQAASWVGTGQNLPISPDVITQILGGQRVQSMGRDFGVDSQLAAGGLASLLPEIINQLTPEGRVDPRHEQAQGDEFAALLEGVRGRLIG